MAIANSGSQPDELPAIIDIVPVGAIVVTVEFLLSALPLYIDPSNIGNAPRTLANVESQLQLHH